MSSTKNNDAKPLAGYEPSAAAGQEDLGGDFNLAGTAGRAARTGCVYGGSDQGAASAAFPPPWPVLGLNPLGRAETQRKAAAGATVPPLPAEPEDLSTELLRKVLAGNREPDISRVKLAKMPAGEGMARLVHDQAQDVGQRDQPRVRGRTREESSGSTGGFVAARHSGQTTCARDLF